MITYTIKPMVVHDKTQEQRAEKQRQQKLRDEWLKSELHSLNYGCDHSAWAQREITFMGEVLQTHHPVVRLSNDDDPHYIQTFNSRAELEAFIAHLRTVADEAWGPA